MKSVFKEIEVIAHFDIDGSIRPYRFKYETPDGNVVVVIDKIIHSAKSRYGGFFSLVYDCRVTINDIARMIQLRYDIASCKWCISKA